jgi:hypothetical protein
MSWIIKLLAALIPGFIKGLLKKSPPSMEVGHSDGETEKRLHEKIDETWGNSDSK